MITGLAVGAVGIDALRHATKRSELPLACLPLVLAAHSLIEAFVWWGLGGTVPFTVGRLALWAYLVIAFCLLPILAPSAVAAIAPTRRRALDAGFMVLGVVVATTLTYALVRGPVVAVADRHHIEYSVDLRYGGLIVGFYVLAVCGPMLLSKHSRVRWFGAANVIAVALLAWLNQSALISLWCLWAAVTSVAIAAHLRAASQPPCASPLPAG